MPTWFSLFPELLMLTELLSIHIRTHTTNAINSNCWNGTHARAANNSTQGTRSADNKFSLLHIILLFNHEKLRESVKLFASPSLLCRPRNQPFDGFKMPCCVNTQPADEWYGEKWNEQRKSCGGSNSKRAEEVLIIICIRWRDRNNKIEERTRESENGRMRWRSAVWRWHWHS